MKTRLVWFLVLLPALVAQLFAAEPRGPQWAKVDEAIEQRLPQTAAERLEPIIAAALLDKAYPEATRAICLWVTFVSRSDPKRDAAGGRLELLQAEIAKAPAPMKPAMEAILGHWYWQYFRQHRWQFQQRTATSVEPGPDLRTWDLQRVLAEIDRHFSAALADPAALQAIPLTDYDELVELGDAPAAYRPTLYDFLVYEALSFYQAGEQGAVDADDPIDIEATGPIFDDAKAFLDWKLPSIEGYSPRHRALTLYQSLLRFHRRDRDRSAFFDADLARLEYGRNVATGETRAERYDAALQRFIAATRDHEISLRATATLGRFLVREGNPARAHELAQAAVRKAPASVGKDACRDLIREIERPSLNLTTEHVWNSGPTLDISYCNLPRVYFRAFLLSFDLHLAKQRWGYTSSPQRELLQQLRASNAALTWEADLPLTHNFKMRTEYVPAPTTLPPGFYAITASSSPTLGEDDTQISVAYVWVSNLALVLRTDRPAREHGGFVLRADTGEPVAGATIRRWQRTKDGTYRPAAPLSSDVNGQFRYLDEENAHILLAEHDGHAVSSSNDVHPIPRFWGNSEKGENKRTVLFTDRAIYRPGQTVHYKGICLGTQPKESKSEVLDDEAVEILLRDPNGKEIARATHRTNDYGSFSGAFTIPAGRGTGHMSLVVEDAAPGQVGISVEEYKRPKFEVTLAAPATAPRLDAETELTGRSVAYTGASIGGAKVRWRVERGAQLPTWCWWWRPPATKAIAHGTTTTNADGSFRISFPTLPDRSIPEKNEPVFTFAVYADVTDSTGETRSAQCRLQVGYTALRAEITCAAWQTPAEPVRWTVHTESLDGTPQPASGTVTVYALRQPERPQRPPQERNPWARFLGGAEPPADPANPDSWEAAEQVATAQFKTDAKGTTQVEALLKPGIYRYALNTRDHFGKDVTARGIVYVTDPAASHFAIKVPHRFAMSQRPIEPGETLHALWGTGYESGRAFIEVECRGKVLRSYWTAPNRTQEHLEIPVTEAMRGGLTLRVTFVRENRAYLDQQIVSVPWSDRQLTIKWETFRSRLLPGQKETWSALIAGPQATAAAAEMVATLYDASLDAFRRHSWPQSLNAFRFEYDRVSSEFQNPNRAFTTVQRWQHRARNYGGWVYPRFPRYLIASTEAEIIKLSAFHVATDRDLGYQAASTVAGSVMSEEREMTFGIPQVRSRTPGEDLEAPSPPALETVTARRNLSETAFFFPHLLAGEDGVVRMTFTMPEALTQWKFLGFAHDAKLRSGFLTGTTVTAKELMVEPNQPRFVREGDMIEFTVKVTNQSGKRQTGRVRLTFADAASLESRDAAVGNHQPEQTFDVPAGESRSHAWRISIPDGVGFLTYKAVAAAEVGSDGEEGNLPVLSRRVLVTESLPLPIRGRTTKAFTFTKLVNSGQSTTLRHQSLTAQMTAQPAWYAVMALPYLMEFPHACSEQVFNRLYANALARHIAQSDPKIHRVFEQWKNTPALDSPLAKNPELKALMLEDTPWLRTAQKESENRRALGILFDDNRLEAEAAAALEQLTQQQLSDGRWPWFPGGAPSEYISLYIVAGFGRLRHLGVDVDAAPAIKAVTALDRWCTEHYESLQQNAIKDAVPTYTDALYLYGRSFFLKDRPVAAEHREAFDDLLRRARLRWTKIDSRQSLAHLALGLQRSGDRDTPAAILRSLKERSVVTEEMGRHWVDGDESWWWYRAPIETQAMMIEAFADVGHDDAAVEECQVWLLKQKQTQNWRTTKATADAIYALLLRGTSLLASDALVELTLGDQRVQPEKSEAGTGFYERRYSAAEVKPELGRITVRKTDDGVSWGSVHWQYLESIDRVTPHEGTPLKLKKTLWTKENTARGPVLRPVKGPVAVGDELVVRIELRVDREMEFVHLKDQRGSGTEPVNVLSRYRYQDGLAYYESTRDTASHFFIDRLPRGTYVFEYSTRVQLKGSYQTGIAEIQCMYAPEFNSHSESLPIEVR